jgi:hypothetical protein
MIEINMSQLLTAEDKAAAAKAEKTFALHAEARAYLAQTDWYVTRMGETAKAIPPNVIERRAAARELLE